MTPRPSLAPLRFLLPCSLLALTLGLTGCGKTETAVAPAPSADTPSDDAAAVVLESVDQRVSYGIAYNLGAQLARDGTLVTDLSAMIAGIEDGLALAETRISQGDIEAAFGAIQQKAAQAQAMAGQTNLTAAQAFLATNGQRSGVTTTASGLQYEVLSSGTGAKPAATDSVEVHYHGTLIDGTVFDSSVQRGQTISFAVAGVIPGWTEALQLMSVGDKWKLFIPPGLGYGPRAAGQIPPNSALIFEVELIAIK